MLAKYLDGKIEYSSDKDIDKFNQDVVDDVMEGKQPHLNMRLEKGRYIIYIKYDTKEDLFTIDDAQNLPKALRLEEFGANGIYTKTITLHDYLELDSLIKDSRDPAFDSGEKTRQVDIGSRDCIMYIRKVVDKKA